MSPKYKPLRSGDLDYDAVDSFKEAKNIRRALVKLIAISVILLLLITNVGTVIHYSVKQKKGPIPQDYGRSHIYLNITEHTLILCGSDTRFYLSRYHLEPILVEYRIQPQKPLRK